MPREIGKLRPSFDIIFPERVVDENVVTTVSNTKKAVSIVLTTSKMEHIILGSAAYGFYTTAPEDDLRIVYVLARTTGHAVGDTIASGEFSTLSRHAFVYDVKAYEMTGSDFVWVDRGSYVDFDPDQPLYGDNNDQLMLAISTQKADIPVGTWINLYYTRVLRQRIFKNDSAFIDYSFDEIVGNITE